MAGLDYLGNKELLDPKRYEWISRNLPAVKNAEVFTDNNCTFYKIYFREDGKDLLIRFVPRRGRYRFYMEPECYRGNFYFHFKQSPLALRIHDYRELTALQILHDLYSGSDTTYPLGKNFEDGLFSFYQAHKLDIGFVLYPKRRHNEQVQP